MIVVPKRVINNFGVDEDMIALNNQWI